MSGSTNFFFNNFQASQEQLLLENLIIESMSVYGQDMYYIPRKLNSYDDVYGADDQSSYENAYPIVMYIESVDGFGGDGDFMSKFGVEIRNQVTFSVAIRTFNEEVGEFTTQVRPNEGDLIYFPLNQKCFQIKYVEKFQMFYQLGKLYTFKLTCELFEYSGELLNTGIPDIDILQQKLSTNILDWTILFDGANSAPIMTEDSDYLILEGSSLNDKIPASDNEEIQNESDLFIDFSALDPFSDGNI